jgi:PhnB protein
MSISAYLYFNGNCREALEFYAEAFQTEKAKILTYGDIPGGGGTQMPGQMKKLVLHAAMRISGDEVRFSDASPDMPVKAGSNVSILVNLETPDMVVAVFDRLKKGGEVVMEVQETFFSPCYAYVIDRFGVSWQLNVPSTIG